MVARDKYGRESLFEKIIGFFFLPVAKILTCCFTRHRHMSTPVITGTSVTIVSPDRKEGDLLESHLKTPQSQAFVRPKGRSDDRGPACMSQ